MNRVRIHATPAKAVTAPFTVHVRTAFVLLNMHSTARIWTLSDIFENCKASESPFVQIFTLSTLMPRLLAFKACKFPAMSALKLVALFFFDDVFFTLEIWTPDSVWVFVNLARQAYSLKFAIILVTQK